MRFLLLILLSINICYAANWECINRWMGTTCHTWKMRVPTGWVVASEGTKDGEYGVTFVPDASHEWRD